MNLKAVLFDLDGTLLPMDQEVFVKAYMGTMGKKLVPHGYDPEMLKKAIWGGIKAMRNNDGSCKNEEAFWKVFTSVFGEQPEEKIAIFEEYYRNEFQQVKDVCGYNPESAKTVQKIREKGYGVVLATNPLFPSIATESRMRWAGLSPEDFDLYTTYENSCYCKPNLDYYREILGKLDLLPEECLMVGNDVSEDMVTEELGMKVFLLTADLINDEGKDITKYPQGDFGDLLAYIDRLNS